MAARVIAQILVNGASIFTRAFINAYQQALRNAKAGGATNATARAIKFKMQPDEAMKILSIERHEFSREVLDQRYKKYFELNDPAKGGSFYIQSKIFRSKEVLDKELDGTNAAEAEAEANADGKASTEQPPNEDKKDSK